MPLPEPRVVELDRDDPRLAACLRTAWGDWFRPTGPAFAFLVGEDVVAAGCYSRQGFDATLLHSAVVLPAYRGRGLHRALVRLRCARAVEWGRATAYACAHPDNAAAIASFKKEGFLECASVPGVSVGTYPTFVWRPVWTSVN